MIKVLFFTIFLILVVQAFRMDSLGGGDLVRSRRNPETDGKDKETTVEGETTAKSAVVASSSTSLPPT
jgi:hypothetical protein